jgi:hypothetical protein
MKKKITARSLEVTAVGNRAVGMQALTNQMWEDSAEIIQTTALQLRSLFWD